SGSRYAPIVNSFGGNSVQSAGRLVSELIERRLLPKAPRILDVGAGSAIWSLAFAIRDPAATITAVDRQAVLEVTRANADMAGVGNRMTTLAGDWRDVSLPCEAFDLILLANLCHLEPGDAVAELIQRVRPALR